MNTSLNCQDMKEIRVKKIEAVQLRAADVSRVLEEQNIPEESIDILNWEEYPYRPKVTFRIAHNNKCIFLNYRVEENSVRAVAGKDNGPVWTDSCVEFFLSFSPDAGYYNLEANCIGTVLLGKGKDRHGRIHVSPEIIDKIVRWSSLGREPFQEKPGLCRWELSLVIPTEVFEEKTELSGKTIKGNFYKCGDELQTPHFLSWNPINTDKPDFHRPEFFGQIIFE